MGGEEECDIEEGQSQSVSQSVSEATPTAVQGRTNTRAQGSADREGEEKAVAAGQSGKEIDIAAFPLSLSLSPQ